MSWQRSSSLFDCTSLESDTSNRAKRRKTQSPATSESEENDVQALKDNTIFNVENSTGPTIIINDSCNPIIPLGGSGESQENYARTEPVQNNAGISDPTSQAVDPPIDIAAGPNQSPVQPKIEFPTTL